MGIVDPLPCQSCRSENVNVKRLSVGLWAVSCLTCGHQGKSRSTPLAAIGEWNTRPGEPLLQEQED